MIRYIKKLKFTLFILIAFLFLSFQEWSIMQPVTIVFNFEANSSNLTKGMKKGIKEYYYGVSDTFYNKKQMYISLYPEEEGFYKCKNLNKYLNRAKNLTAFIRTELDYDGELTITYERYNKDILDIDCQISIGWRGTEYIRNILKDTSATRD